MFRRQHPYGPYILEVYCARARLVVEVDGQSHGMGDRPRRDERRDRFLEAQGLRVMRYPATEVMADPYGVAQSILEAAEWSQGSKAACPLRRFAALAPPLPRMGPLRNSLVVIHSY